jgi:hypothetical protein
MFTCNCAPLSCHANANRTGQVTEQDRYDWILLYCGLHQDMLKIQQEVRTTMLAGAHPNAAAPYFFGRFLKVMEGRVAVLGRGGPIVVEVSGRLKTAGGCNTHSRCRAMRPGCQDALWRNGRPASWQVNLHSIIASRLRLLCRSIPTVQCILLLQIRGKENCST